MAMYIVLIDTLSEPFIQRGRVEHPTRASGDDRGERGTARSDGADGAEASLAVSLGLARPTATAFVRQSVNQFEDGTVRPVDEGAFVSGRTVSLIALAGDRDASQVDPVSLEAAALSAPTRTVRVTNAESGSPIVIRIRTDLAAETWAELLADEPNVAAVRSPDDGTTNAVDVVLREGVTYELRLAKLGVGPGTAGPEPAYVTAVTSTNLLADVGRPQPLAVEVRNEFNGPEAGVPVTFETPGGDETTVTTDDEGRATLRYTPPPVSDTTVIARADLDGDGAVSDEEEVRFTVNPRGSGDDFTLNPIGSQSVLRFEEASVRREGTGQDRVDVIDITFENTGDVPIDVSAMRVNFYFAGAPGADASQPTPPDYALVRSLDDERLDIRGDFTTVSDGDGPWTIPADPDETLTLEFFTEDDDPYAVNELDFLVLTVEYPDGRGSSYIIAPEFP